MRMGQFIVIFCDKNIWKNLNLESIYELNSWKITYILWFFYCAYESKWSNLIQKHFIGLIVQKISMKTYNFMTILLLLFGKKNANPRTAPALKLFVVKKEKNN